ncbi:MAG: hypothetical protein AB7V56_09035 [Candidatus Nitrosocosmicus sp.]
MTTIIIEKRTRDRLCSTGRKDQTYDDIINELLEKAKKNSIDSTKSIEQEKK